MVATVPSSALSVASWARYEANTLMLTASDSLSVTAAPCRYEASERDAVARIPAGARPMVASAESLPRLKPVLATSPMPNETV